MKKISHILITFVSLVIPFFLIMTSVRIMISPWFATFEYNRSNFPADPYGFTKEERLKYAHPSINYLLNDAGPAFLADIKLADGSPLYNERELSHMVDVKVLVQRMLAAWYVMLGLFAVVLLLAVRTKQVSYFFTGLSSAGIYTIGLIGLILVGVVLGFNSLFTGFHMIFFQGDTWLFYYSDSLIRLFPMQFWQDAFTGMGLITLALAGLLIVIGKRYRRNPR